MTTIANTGTVGKLELTKATSWADVVRAAQAAEQAAAPQPEPAPAVATPLPKPLVLSDEEKVALGMFKERAAHLAVPQERRTLSLDELTSINTFLATAKVVAKVAKRATEDTIKPALFGHFDVVAEQKGLADPATTPRHKDGWYLLEDKESGKVADLNASAERELRSGSVSLTEEGLKRLKDEGRITHAQYLKMTRQVRVVDEDAVLAAVKEDPALVEVLREATVVGNATVALTIR